MYVCMYDMAVFPFQAPAVIWAEVMAAQANAVLNLTHVERKLQDGLTAWLSDLTQVFLILLLCEVI